MAKFHLLIMFSCLAGLSSCTHQVDYEIKVIKFETIKVDNMRALNWTGLTIKKIDRKKNAIHGTMEILPYDYSKIQANFIMFAKMNNEYKESAIQIKEMSICDFYLRDKMFIPDFINKSDMKKDKCFEPKVYHIYEYVPTPNAYFPSTMPGGKDWRVDMYFRDKTDGSLLNGAKLYVIIDKTDEAKMMSGK